VQTLNSNVDDVVVVGGEVVEKQRSKLVGKFLSHERLIESGSKARSGTSSSPKI